MKLNANPTAAAVSQFIMRTAFPLGIYFIAEYLVSVAAMGNLSLMAVRLLMAVATPVALFFLMRMLRDRVLDGYIRGRQVWLYGVHTMIFAALVEAAFVYIYNEFLDPGNLLRTQQAAIAQFEASRASLEAMPGAGGAGALLDTMNSMVEELRNTRIPTAIEAAVSQLSNDFLAGIVLMLAIAPAVRRRKTEA